MVAIVCCLAISSASADSIWDYEAVGLDGFGIHPKVNASSDDPESRVVVEGVALAGVSEILNPGSAYTAFVQDDRSDRGGIQAWAGSWFYGGLWSTMRQSNYVDFQAGDRLRITGLLSDAGRGKVVINHRHSSSPALAFTVEIIGHSGLPDPEPIPTVAHCNYFDQTRAGGGERYQTRYVMLHGVEITGDEWGSGSLMTIADASGSVGMLLSATGDFSSYAQPSGRVNVVGVFDQEDTTAPYTGDYRVWVRRFDDMAVALDSCREVRSRDEGERVALAGKVVSRVYDGFFYILDADRTGGVRVVSDRVFAPGDVVCVQGLVATAEGEKAIVPKYLSLTGSAPKPLFVNSAALWGESGLDVSGLLVRCAATVGTEHGDGAFSLIDDAGRTIYLRTNGVEMPPQGARVAVTAVLGSMGGAPLLHLADRHDLQVME